MYTTAQLTIACYASGSLVLMFTGIVARERRSSYLLMVALLWPFIYLAVGVLMIFFPRAFNSIHNEARVRKNTLPTPVKTDESEANDN